MRRAWLLLLAWPGLAYAQADGGVTVVNGSRNRLPGVTALRGAEARETPLVEHDALKAVQTFPGVGRPALGSADLVVFGAAPKDTRVEVDGIEVPALFHLGGHRSVLSSALVERIELEPAALRPDVGRGLGGVVRVETAPAQPGVHGVISSDLSDSSATVSVAGEEASLSAAARGSTLAAVVSPFLRGAAADRFALPSSWDAQLKATWTPSARDHLAVLALASSDQLSLTVGSDDPTLARGRRETSDFYRLGVTWRRGEPTEGVTVTAFAGLDRHLISLTTPLAEAHAREEKGVGGLKARWRASLREGLAVTCGFDGLLTHSQLERAGPLTLPAREGDVTAFGQPLSDDRAVDTWRVGTTDAAVFAGLDLTVGPVTVAPALRLAAIAREVSRRTPRVAATPGIGLSALDFSLEPRLTASWGPVTWLTLTAAAGLSHQAADASEQSALFGTPELGPSHGAHVAAGLVLTPAPAMRLEATGFFRSSNRLVVRDPDVRAALAQVLRQEGEGRAVGMNVAARGSWHGLSGSLSYTLARSERRSNPGDPWRLADFDQTHVLSAAATQKWEAWRFGARFRWATGLPRTPVIASSFDVRRGVFEPRFGAQNSTRLPDFLQLDVEASRSFSWGRWWLEVFVEVLNVTNRPNVEEWIYDSTFSRRADLTGLPVFGTLGLRGRF